MVSKINSMNPHYKSDESPLDEFFHLHPDVVRIKKHALPDWLEDQNIIVREVEGGYTLYGFPVEDFYMLRAPYGMWRRVYLGQEDKNFNQEVLEQKYGLKHLCDISMPELSNDKPTALYI